MSRWLALISLATLASACASSNSGDPVPASAGPLAQRADVVPVYLDRTFGVLAPATLGALKSNAYLQNEFIDVEVQIMSSPAVPTYDRVYLNARETRSLLVPEGAFANPFRQYKVTFVGFDLNAEVGGGLENSIEQWTTEFADGAIPIQSITHEVNGAQVPWLRVSTPTWTQTLPNQVTSLWSVEYQPNPGSTAPRTRHEERAAHYQPSKLAENVVAAYFGIDTAAERDLIRRSFAAVGWTITPVAEGFSATSPNDGDTSRVLVFESAADQGLRALTWQLSRPTSPHVESIDANVELRVAQQGPSLATMWFVRPSPTEEALVARITAP